MEPCKKVIGTDFELSNSLETRNSRDGNPAEATRLLLAELPGYPRRANGGTVIEWARRYLPGCGGSAYEDSNHLEMNAPEHTRAEDHPAIMHALLRIARRAQVAAMSKLPAGTRLTVIANVSDGNQSWGHHVNIAISRSLFDEMFTRKPHLASFVATHLATAPIYTGQGHVGPGNDRSWCDFQISQRADWFEQFVSHETMHRRGLLNLRDEPHAGDDVARLHLIPFDLVLNPIANYLMVGTTQLVAAMAEARYSDPGLCLDDPLDAFREVSRDLTLQKQLPMAQRGKYRTAVEVQRGLADLAGEFVSTGAAEKMVPGAEAIVKTWHETLDILAKRDLVQLARRCDWPLKFILLDRHRGKRGLTWRSPEVKCLDLMFGSLDPDEGLFLQMAAAGHIDNMPSDDLVERFVQEPPDDTRAYLRAHALRRYGDHVSNMDWDRIRFRLQSDRYWSTEAYLRMPDPAGHGREVSEPILAKCNSLQELIAAFGTESRAKDDDFAPSWARGNGSQATYRSGRYRD
jgi:proteasome accessory factor A